MIVVVVVVVVVVVIIDVVVIVVVAVVVVLTLTRIIKSVVTGLYLLLSTTHTKHTSTVAVTKGKSLKCAGCC